MRLSVAAETLNSICDTEKRLKFSIFFQCRSLAGARHHHKIKGLHAIFFILGRPGGRILSAPKGAERPWNAAVCPCRLSEPMRMSSGMTAVKKNSVESMT